MVNYDDFMILTELLDDNSHRVKGLMERFYARVSCYSTWGNRGISARLGIKERTVRNP